MLFQGRDKLGEHTSRSRHLLPVAIHRVYPEPIMREAEVEPTDCRPSTLGLLPVFCRAFRHVESAGGSSYQGMEILSRVMKSSLVAYLPPFTPSLSHAHLPREAV